MEFYVEFLLSVISIFLIFLFAKLASRGDGGSAISSAAADFERRLRCEEKAAGPADQPEIGGRREKLGEEAETVGGARGESVPDVCGIDDEVLGADWAGSGEIGEVEVEEEEEEIIRVVDEKLVRSKLGRAEEVKADELDVKEEDEENGEEKRPEVNDVVLEDCAKELPVKVGKVDAELAMGGIEVEEVVQCAGVRPLHGGSETGIGREEKSGIGERGESLLYGEDEWEGIERSGLEKLFHVATEYVGSENGGYALSKLSSDVQKQLYGLHKVAMEGPCYEPQPLALKIAARSKWHAWQRLGNMNPEVAMEQYISLLSENIPGWMEEQHGGDKKHDKGNDTMEASVPISGKPDLISSLHGQPSSGTQRISEDPSCIAVDNATTGPMFFEQGLTKTFLFNLLSPTRVTFLFFY